MEHTQDVALHAVRQDIHTLQMALQRLQEVFLQADQSEAAIPVLIRCYVPRPR